MRLPFEGALAPEDAARMSPKVREHFLQPVGTRRLYRGTMGRVWRAGGARGALARPALWASSRAHLLFDRVGTDVGFELENVVTPHPDGRARMTWTRTFRFPDATHVFHAVMACDPGRRLVDDRLGRNGELEVHLQPRVLDDGSLAMESRRQWLRLGRRVRVPLPGWAAGRASIHEWERPDGSLGIRVAISNPVMGEFFGYEGSFQRVE